MESQTFNHSYLSLSRSRLVGVKKPFVVKTQMLEDQASVEHDNIYTFFP